MLFTILICLFTFIFLFGFIKAIWDLSGYIFNRESQPTYQLNKFYTIINSDMYERMKRHYEDYM